MKKILAIMGLAALVATPALAFAQDGQGKDKGEKERGAMFDKTTVSIGISNNGSVLVRGAKVTDVNDSDLVATTIVNGVTLTWSIDADGDTDFVEADGDAMAITEISEGDYVSFSGMLTGSTSVDADTVRDWSVDEDDSDDDDKDDNGNHLGFWNKLKNWPGFSFWAHAKVDNR